MSAWGEGRVKEKILVETGREMHTVTTSTGGRCTDDSHGGPWSWGRKVLVLLQSGTQPYGQDISKE